MSPTQRSLKVLRNRWPLVEVTEHYVRFGSKGGFRKDLFGFVDILCVAGDMILAVQTTTGANTSKRIEKIQTLPSAVYWLRNPMCRIMVHGWRQIKEGTRRIWRLREIEIVLSETGSPIVKP